MAPNRFTCEQVFARLDDFVDRELSAEEMRLVQEHLDTCAACAGEHRFEATVLDDVRRKVTRIGVPPSLLSGVAERLARAYEAERGIDGG
ncbi:MAG TPA: zf-HC2 domain-containing protein [Gemmatimonadales bacterium]|nr:zf-HC2 domain-containing protein [Gemmatimonadales bacterium]